MKIFTWITALFISILGLTSCDNSPKSSTLVSHSTPISFSSFKEVHGYKINKTGLFFRSAIADMAVLDSLLLLSNFTDSLVIQVASTKSNRVLFSLIKRGTGTNECLNVVNFIPTASPSTFWAYDITLRKFMKFNLLRMVAHKENYQYESSFIIQPAFKGLKSPCWISDTIFAGCSYFFDDCRYFYIDKSSHVLKKIGQLPVKPEGWPTANPAGNFGLLSQAFGGNICKRPGLDNFVIGYSNTERLDFYHKGKLFKVILEPSFTDPVYNFQRRNSVTLTVNTAETRYTNLNLKATKNFVYVLYSGRKNFQYYGQRILIFDWNGKPVKDIRLKSDCKSAFCVQEKSGAVSIYLIDKKTSELICLKFPSVG